MISLAMNVSEAKLLLIGLPYAVRHGKEAFGDKNESVKQVRGVAARLENNLGDTAIGNQLLQGQ